MLKKILIASLMLSSTSVFSATLPGDRSFANLSDPSAANNFLIDNRGNPNYASLILDSALTSIGTFNLTTTFTVTGNNKVLVGLGLFNGTSVTDIFSLVSSPNATGEYLVNLTNLAGGNNYKLYFNVNGGGGNIGGTYNISAPVTTPVPEPETYSMMFAGLTMMGVVAFRRKKNS